MWVRAVSTECTVRKREAATSRFVLPSATRRAIRRSASVRWVPIGARPPIRLRSGAARPAPGGPPEPLEAGQRVVEAHSRSAALLRAPLRAAEREQRARVLGRGRRARTPRPRQAVAG